MLSARKSLSIFALSLFLLPAVTQAQHYKQTNLVSDVQGMAPVMDPNLKNPWGLTRSSTTPTRPGSPFWIGNNNSGTSSLYGDGVLRIGNRTGPERILLLDDKGSRAPYETNPAARWLACRVHLRHGRWHHFRLEPGRQPRRGCHAAFDRRCSRSRQFRKRRSQRCRLQRRNLRRNQWPQISLRHELPWCENRSL